MKKTPFKSILKKYAPTFAGAAIIIGGITSAALTEIPSSLPASVSDGDIIEASHISDVFSAIRILDDRTDGDTPVDGVDLANKDYVDNEITTATSDLASTSYVDTQVSTAGDDLGNHTASQTINANNQKITNLSTPTANTDATTKEYVDGVVGASGSGSGPTFRCETVIRQNDPNFSHYCYGNRSDGKICATRLDSSSNYTHVESLSQALSSSSTSGYVNPVAWYCY